MKEYYIYKHTNKTNGKSYIGQTSNIKSRWRESSYKNNRKFYNALKKYGWDNFTHEILEVCDENNVDERERYYIEFYDSINNGYNLESGGNKNKHLSEETKEKLRKFNQGKKHGKRSPEIVEKVRKANLGKHRSAEYILKRSEQVKEEYRTGKRTAAFLGKHLSEETKEKLRLCNKKTCKRVRNKTTNEIFESLHLASKKYNVAKTSISHACRGIRKTAGGYEWEFLEKEG